MEYLCFCFKAPENRQSQSSRATLFPNPMMKGIPMRSLFQSVLLTIPSFAAILIANIAWTDQALAQLVELADKDVQWAWNSQEVGKVGNGFWPQYRGPKGDGHAAASCDPPILWNESTNIAWRTDLTGKAWSSPVVWGEKIWLTNATNDGLSMSVLAIDRNDGKVLFDRVIFTNRKRRKTITNSTPTAPRLRSAMASEFTSRLVPMAPQRSMPKTHRSFGSDGICPATTTEVLELAPSSLATC